MLREKPWQSAHTLSHGGVHAKPLNYIGQVFECKADTPHYYSCRTSQANGTEHSGATNATRVTCTSLPAVYRAIHVRLVRLAWARDLYMWQTRYGLCGRCSVASSSYAVPPRSIHDASAARGRLTQARRVRLAGKARQEGTGLARHVSPAPCTCRAYSAILRRRFMNNAG